MSSSVALLPDFGWSNHETTSKCMLSCIATSKLHWSNSVFIYFFWVFRTNFSLLPSNLLFLSYPALMQFWQSIAISIFASAFAKPFNFVYCSGFLLSVVKLVENPCLGMLYPVPFTYLFPYALGFLFLPKTCFEYPCAIIVRNHFVGSVSFELVLIMVLQLSFVLFPWYFFPPMNNVMLFFKFCKISTNLHPLLDYFNYMNFTPLVVTWTPLITPHAKSSFYHSI